MPAAWSTASRIEKSTVRAIPVFSGSTMACRCPGRPNAHWHRRSSVFRATSCTSTSSRSARTTHDRAPHPVTNPKRRIPMRPTLRLLSRPSAAACVLTVALLPIAGCGSKSSTSDANETAASTVSIAPRRSDRRTRTRSRRQACSSARAVLSASRTRPTRTTRSRASPTQGSARRRSRRTRRSPHVLHDGYLHVQQHRASGSNTVGDR